MGCVSSNTSPRSSTNNNRFQMRKVNNLNDDNEQPIDVDRNMSKNQIKERCPELTDYHKELIKGTWEIAITDISRIGVIAFTSLFETHPSVQDMFISFKDLNLEELKLSGELRSHALNVTNFVQKVIARLNEPEKAIALLQEAGKRHVEHGAPSHYLQYVGPQFIKALKPSIGYKWDADVNSAWTLLFEFIVYHMKSAMKT